jgi:hypothetical protein
MLLALALRETVFDHGPIKEQSLEISWQLNEAKEWNVLRRCICNGNSGTQWR